MPIKTLDQLVYPVVEEFRQTLRSPEQFVPRPETELIGSQAALDSLALVSFIVALEEKIETETGQQVRLVDEKALSLKNSPFRTLSTLADYIDSMLAANG